MKKIYIFVIAIIVLVALGYVAYITTPPKEEVSQIVPGPKNAAYKINGETITLKNGVSEIEAAPGSASKITTTYFGNSVSHDFDADGRNDEVFLVTQSTGGTGTFFYVVAALNTANGFVGSEAYLLGDRIAPQTTEVKGNIIVVNYAERKPGEDFTVAPSVGKTVQLLLDTKTLQFGIVANNFEGEADPARMDITMNKWNWVSTVSSKGTVVPKLKDRFTLTFKKDNTFSASTDCNGIGGEYKLNAVTGQIMFDKMMSTLMYCEGSQEAEYSKALSDVASFKFTSKGELLLTLKNNGGTMTFR